MPLKILGHFYRHPTDSVKKSEKQIYKKILTKCIHSDNN